MDGWMDGWMEGGREATCLVKVGPMKPVGELEEPEYGEEPGLERRESRILLLELVLLLLAPRARRHAYTRDAHRQAAKVGVEYLVRSPCCPPPTSPDPQRIRCSGGRHCARHMERGRGQAPGALERWEGSRKRWADAGWPRRGKRTAARDAEDDERRSSSHVWGILFLLGPASSQTEAGQGTDKTSPTFTDIDRASPLWRFASAGNQIQDTSPYQCCVGAWTRQEEIDVLRVITKMWLRRVCL